jgi:hypothetical protein
MSDLPEFEGQVPVGVVTSVSGTSQRIDRPIHMDETVLLLVEARVGSIAHKVVKDGLKRHQTLTAKDVYELEGTDGRDLLRAARNRYQLADDASKGRVGLPLDDTLVPQQFVDQGGVIMTPAEVREARGEDWDPADELTVVFADGTRAFWPDDWAGSGQSLAPAGGFMRLPNGELGETVQVVELLDPESGAAVATWSEEDEAERLEALEGQLAAEEARADREAVEGMERPADSDEAEDLEGDEGED